MYIKCMRHPCIDLKCYRYPEGRNQKSDSEGQLRLTKQHKCDVPACLQFFSIRHTLIAQGIFARNLHNCKISASKFLSLSRSTNEWVAGREVMMPTRGSHLDPPQRWAGIGSRTSAFLPHLQLLNLCFVHSLYIHISQLGNVQGGT